MSTSAILLSRIWFIALVLVVAGCSDNTAAAAPRGAAGSGATQVKSSTDEVVVYGLDPSPSVVVDRSENSVIDRRCAEVETDLVARARAKPFQSLQVLILQTGATGQTVRTVVPWRRVFGLEGRPRVELLEATKARVLKQAIDIANECRARAVPSEVSPVWSLAEAALAEAKDRCASRCREARVRLHTDGEDNTLKWLVNLLKGKQGAAVPPEGVLDPASVEVEMCGFSEAQAPVAEGRRKPPKGVAHRAPVSLTARTKIWQAVFGGTPIRVLPTCPTTATAASSGESAAAGNHRQK